MKRSIIFLLFIAPFLTGAAYAQTDLTSKVKVTVMPKDSADGFVEEEEDNAPRQKVTDTMSYFRMYPYMIAVKQTVNVGNQNNGLPIRLSLEHSGPLNSFLTPILFHGFSVYSPGDGDDSDYRNDVAFEFDGFDLVIQPAQPESAYTIKYNYQSDYGTKCGNETLHFLQPQIYDWHSWYFTSPGMTVTEVEFEVLDGNSLLFVTSGYKANGLIEVDMAQVKDNDISFYIIDKDYYKVVNDAINALNITYYHTKGSVTDTVLMADGDKMRQFVKTSPGKRYDAEKSAERRKAIGNSMRRIMPYFNVPNPTDVKIADGYLHDEDNTVSWGNTTKAAGNEYLILIDTSMWDDNTVIHELLHTIIPSGNTKGKPYHYFFSESMIEYLSIWAAYPEPSQRGSVFAAKYEKFSSLIENGGEAVSIKNLEDNSLDEDSPIGSAHIIYMKTPVAIHNLAKVAGEDAFVEAVGKFYNAVSPDNYNMRDFEMFIKRTGRVSDHEWNNFVRYL